MITPEEYKAVVEESRSFALSNQRLVAQCDKLSAALKKIEDRTNDPVARSIAGEALVD